MREIRFGVGLSYAPGPPVFALKIVRFLRPDATRYHHIDQGLMTSPNDTYTQRFTFVDPSELHLARFSPAWFGLALDISSSFTRGGYQPRMCPMVTESNTTPGYLYNHSSQATSCRTAETRFSEYVSQNWVSEPAHIFASRRTAALRRRA